MKAGTKARLVRFALIIGFSIFMVVPAVSLITDTGDNAPVQIGVPAEYDIRDMTEDDLVGNISTAISNRPGCSITYGDETVGLDGADLDKVASDITASGSPTAIVVDQNGNTVIQSEIVMTDAVSYTIVTGIKATGMLASTSEVIMSMHITTGDVRMEADVRTMSSGDFMRVEMTIPNIVMVLAEAVDAEVGMDVGLNYNKLIGFSINTGSNPIVSDAKYTFVELAGKESLTITDFDFNMTGIGSIGDVTVIATDIGGMSSLTLVGDGGVVDALRDSMVDGRLTISMDGDEYTMSEGLSGSFVDAISMMGASA